MRSVIVGAVILAFSWGAARAVPVPNIALQNLINEATLICAGRVGAIAGAGKATENVGGKELELDRKLADVQCERVHKGVVSAGTNIKVEFLDYVAVPLPYPVLSSNQQVLLFLVNSGTPGIFKAPNPYRWVQPLVGGNIQVAGAGTREKVEAELMHAVSEGNETTAEPALRGLFELESKELLRPPKAVKEPIIKEALDEVSIALRIKRGEDAALEEAGRLKSFQTERDSYKPWQGAILREVGNVRRKGALPGLHRLVKHKNSRLRLEAALALKESGDETSVPYLVDCLGDENPDTAMSCLSGLSRITKRPGPGSKEFKRTRKQVETEWKDWLKKRQGKSP